ncbi:DUF397 domain-containing protein [Actinomadura madurae]|uniref:DUF397 domain-containing protein n=1 Tax=Actinomadura madurae TaxID=1993 RepID=UPI003999C7BB
MNTSELSRARWRKSTYSGAHENDCVEVADLQDYIAIRDSRNPAAGHLTLTRHHFTALLARLTMER